MLFSSLEFIFLFLPLCIGIYFGVPLGWRNAVLLFFSLIFYGFGEPVYVFLMIFTVLGDYIFALSVQRNIDNKNKSRARLILTFAIIFNLAILAFFKYYDFTVTLISSLPFGIKLRPLNIPLPVGISFYTFQALSYVIDVYRQDATAAKDPLTPATYVALFPQLVAGPIIRYNDIEGQIRKRSHSLSLAAEGIRRFTAGLAKKVLLANTAGEMWQNFAQRFESGRADTLGVWLGVIFFAFQIYFDFSGYSDMAIGLGKIFGFSFPENFNYPYVSESITDFWRRWHITLSTWFREYVYIPLGGNRRGKGRMYLNLFVVWSLTGIWHGAGGNFLLWGLYYFLILSIEKAFLLKYLEKLPRALRHVYALLLILFGWLIFASDGAPSSLTLTQALSCVKIMFGAGGTPPISELSKYELVRNIIPLLIMSLASLPLFKTKTLSLLSSKKYGTITLWTLNLLSVLTLILCTAYLVNSGYNPFLYFRF